MLTASELKTFPMLTFPPPPDSVEAWTLELGIWVTSGKSLIHYLPTYPHIQNRKNNATYYHRLTRKALRVILNIRIYFIQTVTVNGQVIQGIIRYKILKIQNNKLHKNSKSN